MIEGKVWFPFWAEQGNLTREKLIESIDARKIREIASTKRLWRHLVLRNHGMLVMVTELWDALCGGGSRGLLG